MKQIKVIVADDHAVVRIGLVALLESEKDIAVVGEVGDGEETVRRVRELKPDVVLMDLVMPRKNGIEATAEIKRDRPGTKVLVLTTFSNADDIAQALEAGADGALLKSADYAEVVSALRTVVRGGRCVSDEISKMLKEQAPQPDLSERQQEILASMARGLTNADIGIQLGITADGVKFHISSILAKIGAANRSEAVAIALKKHLLKI